MKKYTFINPEKVSFSIKGNLLFSIMNEKQKYFEDSSIRIFNKDINNKIFKKRVFNNIKNNRSIYKNYGSFGQAILKITPWSYTRDVLSLSFIVLLCFFAEVNIIPSIILTLVYICLSIMDNATKKQQIKHFLNTGIIRVQEMYGTFEYTYKQEVAQNWINNDVSEEEISIIKELLSKESFENLFSKNTATEIPMKYGEERYLSFLYHLKNQLNRNKECDEIKF